MKERKVIRQMRVRKSSEARVLLGGADAIRGQDGVKKDGVFADVCLPCIGGPPANALDGG